MFIEIRRFYILVLFLGANHLCAVSLPQLSFPELSLPRLNFAFKSACNAILMPPLRKVGDMLETTYDFFGLEERGSKSLSLENELFVRSILNEMGVKRKVCIRKLSEGARHSGYFKNACAVDLGAMCYMFIDEEWFDTLSDDEKRFLIGHETAHIAHCHALIKRSVEFFLIERCIEYIIKKGFNDKFTLHLKLAVDKGPMQEWLLDEIEKANAKFPEFLKKNMPALFEEKVLYRFQIPVFFLTSLFLRGFISRICETDADAHAAHKLDACEGGIKLWQRRINDEDPPSRFALKRGIGRMLEGLKSLVATHPPHEVRIRNLEKIRRYKQVREE